MKNLIGMLIAATLLSSPALAGGAPDFGTPDPEGQAELGTSDFDPVPGACEDRIIDGQYYCLNDADYAIVTAEEPEVQYADEFEAAFNKAAAQYEEGVRVFSGSAEFCSQLTEAFEDIQCR